ncbi:hypothetical protein GGS20DRAFT_360207 [Poronia punctata]|nr:hypothetical protein GGS20DRAFT_360207 [Poronia punctata]
MADRAPPAHARPTTGRVTRAATSTTGVRRNLFQSQLSRRPTANGSTSTGIGRGGSTALTSSSSSTSVETLRLDIDVQSDTSEIVVRDENGEFDLGDPPALALEDSEDDVALDDGQESQRERQRLAEAVRHHQAIYTQMPAQPEELAEMLKASMRAQVAALAEDNWMYEPEEQPRTH